MTAGLPPDPESREILVKHDRTSLWDVLTLLLWAIVFAAGLAPDIAFSLLRAVANVSPQTAFINSSYAITFGLSGYFGIFVLHRCRDAGASEAEARGKAVVATLMAMSAFLELPNRGTSPFEPHTFLEVWIRFRSIEDAYLRNVVLVVGIGKLFCWWFLFALLLRYYAFGSRRVFRMLPPVVPSARAAAGESQPVRDGSPSTTRAGD